MKALPILVTAVILSVYLGPGSAKARGLCSRAYMIVRKSFGCPFGSGECSKFCKEAKAQEGGYCAGKLKESCVCFKN
ncbi:defensin-like [Haemaphysalis longicornis]